MHREISGVFALPVSSTCKATSSRALAAAFCAGSGFRISDTLTDAARQTQ